MKYGASVFLVGVCVSCTDPSKVDGRAPVIDPNDRGDGDGRGDTGSEGGRGSSGVGSDSESEGETPAGASGEVDAGVSSNDDPNGMSARDDGEANMGTSSEVDPDPAGGGSGEGGGTPSELIPEGEYDREAVYLLGTTLDEEDYLDDPFACSEDGVALLEDRFSYSLGLPCSTTAAIMHRGNVLYVYAQTLRRYVADVTSNDAPAGFPDDPAANDPIIPTPECPGEVAPVGPFSQRSLVSSPHGELAYLCWTGTPDSRMWFSSSDGRVVAPGGSQLLAFHEPVSLILSNEEESSIPDLRVVEIYDASGTRTTVTGLELNQGDEVLAARATEGGFVAAVGDGYVESVVAIDLGGRATQRFAITGLGVQAFPMPVVDGDGRLYGMASSDFVRHDADGSRTVLSADADGWVRGLAFGSLMLGY